MTDKKNVASICSIGIILIMRYKKNKSIPIAQSFKIPGKFLLEKKKRLWGAKYKANNW